MPEIADVVPGDPVASNWGNLIRDRSTEKVADATERDALYPLPQAGKLLWVAAPGELQMFDGVAWIVVAPQAPLFPPPQSLVVNSLVLSAAANQPNQLGVIQPLDTQNWRWLVLGTMWLETSTTAGLAIQWQFQARHGGNTVQQVITRKSAGGTDTGFQMGMSLQGLTAQIATVDALEFVARRTDAGGTQIAQAINMTAIAVERLT